ncbi:MAG: DNA-directed RNA polymerase subunit omega [Ruminococcus sp.]|jgi:DNA-directed RNA polymerase subunit omega|nr:DNA-directed RNA polymerase subunit omega [Ruminococcus sp.]
MKKVNVDELFEGKASRYALVIGVAKRARQITKDFEDQEVITDEKSVLLAIDEIKDHKVNILQPEDDD